MDNHFPPFPKFLELKNNFPTLFSKGCHNCPTLLPIFLLRIEYTSFDGSVFSPLSLRLIPPAKEISIFSPYEEKAFSSLSENFFLPPHQTFSIVSPFEEKAYCFPFRRIELPRNNRQIVRRFRIEIKKTSGVERFEKWTPGEGP